MHALRSAFRCTKVVRVMPGEHLQGGLNPSRGPGGVLHAAGAVYTMGLGSPEPYALEIIVVDGNQVLHPPQAENDVDVGVFLGRRRFLARWPPA